MKKVGVLAVAGVGVGLLLFAGSCAPAQAPAPAQPAQQQPAQQQPAAKPAEQKPAASQPAAQQPAKPTRSVSGIPLDPDAKYGGILLTGFGSTPVGLHPWEDALGGAFMAGHPPTNKLIRTQTWGNLEDFNRQAFFNLHPDLAVSWEQAPDGLRWTFKLRDGVKWSDGVPFTCEDAKWSLDTVRTGQGLQRSPRATLFLGVDNIQCADALTMVINMQRRKPSLLEAGIANPTLVILPKHVYADKPEKVDELRSKGIAVGTGPFVRKEFFPGEKYTFVRKSDYWDAPLPYLDGLEVLILSATNVPVSLRAGRIDLSGSFSGFSGAQHATLSKECKECQFWPKSTATNIDTVIPNHQRPPWNTPAIKDALSLAIDRKAYIQLAWEGWAALPAGGGFYPGSYWAMPPERLSQIPGYNFDTPDQNKQRARELLAQAGYKPGELVVPLRVMFHQPAIPVLVEMLEAVGFKADVQFVETGRGYEALSSGDFDVYRIETAVSGGIDPDAITYEHFYTGSDRNYGRWSSSRFDALVNEMSVTLDRERRRQLAWDAMEIALREQGKIILKSIVTASVFGPRVRGLMPGETVAQSAYGPAYRRDTVWLAEK